MRKAGETPGKILSLGGKFIQERGVNGFSFADIAQEMGIRKASIHYYFPSKMDLVAKVLEDYNQAFEQDLEKIKEDSETLFQRLLDFTGLYRAELEQGMISLPSMLAIENHFLSDEINQAVQTFFQMNMRWLEEAGLTPEKARDFYASIQGMQLLAEASQNVDDFDQLMVDKIVAIQKK